MARRTPTVSGPPRWQPLAVVGGALVVVLVVAGLVSLPEQPPSTSTSLALPSPTTSTTRGVPAPEPQTVLRGPILGAGWEVLDPGPIQGRQEVSAVWTGRGLLVWGGYTLGAPGGGIDATPTRRYRNTGFLWDPATETWSGPIIPPEESCSLERTRLAWLDLAIDTSHPDGPVLGHDGYVLLYGEGTGGSPCLNAMLYRPSDGTWHEFDVIGGIFPFTQLVWIPDTPVGPLVVAPERGLGYQVPDPQTHSPIEIPRLVQPNDHRSRSTATRAFWTGDEIVSWGLGSVQAWSFGDDDWHAVVDPPVPEAARDAVWTDRGLMMITHQMAAAIFEGDGAGWDRAADLPLRIYACLPEVVAAAGTPVVRMCSGMAIWDEARSSWIPVPLEDLTGEHLGRLVGGDDAVYSVGSLFRRFRIDHDPQGRVVPPPTIPIGVLQLDIPDGWDLVESFAPSVHVSGTLPDDETIGVVFERDGITCRVASTYAEFGVGAPAGTPMGDIALGPAGSLGGLAYQVTGDEDDEWGILYSVPAGTGTDWMTIRCSGTDRSLVSDATASFGGLWPTWDPRPRAVPYEVGPGWRVLDDEPDATRPGAAAVWTGSRLFVWGGWDAEALQPAALYQGADLYDPVSGRWLRAAPLPDEVCSLNLASVSMMGDLVLVRGAAHDRTDCSQAVAYDPATDVWTALDSLFFDRVPTGSAVVWTGEWVAAPTAGLAYVPSTGQTITIPEVPESGSRVGSPTLSHWTGDRLVTIGAGDVFTLVPGDDAWVRRSGPPLPEGGRDSVWADGWLYVVSEGNQAARFDLDQWEQSDLPLQSSECAPAMLVAARLPVARACSGFAVWDVVRSTWIPFPSDVIAGGAWWTTVVGSDDAIYSLGERLLVYPIDRLGDGTIPTPATIPVGVLQLDLRPSWWLVWSNGSFETEWPDGSSAEVLAFVLSGPNGTCRVSARHGGPAIPGVGTLYDEQHRLVDSYLLIASFEGDSFAAVGPASSDSVWIDCDTEADEALIARGLWLPGSGP